MDFSQNKPIYKQIIDYAFAKILNGEWQPGQRVASVRELAVEMTVNTNTVLKAYESMQNDGIIYPRRGMGYYLSEDARAGVEKAKRNEFFATTLPSLKQEMELLGIPPEELLSHLTATS